MWVEIWNCDYHNRSLVPNLRLWTLASLTKILTSHFDAGFFEGLALVKHRICTSGWDRVYLHQESRASLYNTKLAKKILPTLLCDGTGKITEMRPGQCGASKSHGAFPELPVCVLDGPTFVFPNIDNPYLMPQRTLWFHISRIKNISWNLFGGGLEIWVFSLRRSFGEKYQSSWVCFRYASLFNNLHESMRILSFTEVRFLQFFLYFWWNMLSAWYLSKKLTTHHPQNTFEFELSKSRAMDSKRGACWLSHSWRIRGRSKTSGKM